MNPVSAAAPSSQALFSKLIAWDHLAFDTINHKWTLEFLDRLMPWITDIHQTKLYIILICLLMLLKMKGRAFIVFIGIALSILVADVTAARVIKPYIHRARPEFSQARPRLLVPSQSSESFPSNHAANAFAVATFLSYAVPGFGPPAMLVAILISYSRVYVGVHYPLDVIGGAILGWLSGLLIYVFFTGAHRLVLPDAPRRALPKKWKKRSFTGND